MKRLLLLPLFLAAACGPKQPERGQTQTLAPAAEAFAPVEGQASANDIARFLAGRPVRQGAVLSQMQQTANYQDHANDMATKWRLFASKRTAVQREWSDINVRPLVGNPRAILYPFGGPDLMYVTALFPQASNYVLLGLEPAGGLPYLDNADPGQVMGSLNRLSVAMDAQMKTGYFITKDMKNDLAGGPLPGVAPIMLASLALMDATVDSVEPISAAGRSGVDIRFRLPGGGARRAIYVSGDLSNGGFNASYRSWLSSYSGGVAYFKAASYLMHDSGFSGVRDWVLSNTNAIVQDDSGIPYRYYDSSKWNVRLYGNYDAPIALFAKHNQADLRAAYDAIGGGTPVPFGSGYHFRPDDANLMISTRK
ncbi:hypothetical protein OJ996_04245 [Luteolibacter sp. GHJ8]|uniref:Uncharacterized protein n=1 Tax=Luteolibacter rhizosphaerae TaxID=2989719 RepID=A0ABT3FYU9_9BACT|nr:hypothetical protein [Luteolibacter rhizosphaerae]MCW1912769.1 hypothetical protein [Luteolibacter rhizosphaerae]